MGIKGVIGGDVMFDSSILKPMLVDGEELITFKPNPNGILYGVPKDSEFGKDILNSTLGIIWHSKYSDISDAGRQPFSNSEFKRLRKVPGVSQGIAQQIMSHTGQDEAKRGVGMGVLALALLFSNIEAAGGLKGKAISAAKEEKGDYSASTMRAGTKNYDNEKH